MKNMFIIILISLTGNLWATNDGFFKKENITKEELIAAARGDGSLLTGGITPTFFLEAYAGFYNHYLKKTMTFNEATATIPVWFKNAEVIVLPANTSLVEMYFQKGAKERKRESLPGEEFLYFPSTGKVIASLRCGNPVFCIYNPPKEEEPPLVPVIEPIAIKPPTLTLSANGVQYVTNVPAGAYVTLTWKSENATTCLAEGNWSGTKATGGMETVGPIYSTANYILKASGPGGKAETVVTINVSQNSVATNPSPTEGYAISPKLLIVNWPGMNSCCSGGGCNTCRSNCAPQIPFCGYCSGNHYGYCSSYYNYYHGSGSLFRIRVSLGGQRSYCGACGYNHSGYCGSYYGQSACYTCGYVHSGSCKTSSYSYPAVNYGNSGYYYKEAAVTPPPVSPPLQTKTPQIFEKPRTF